MKFLALTIETKAGEQEQHDIKVAKCEDHQDPQHVGDAVAKEQFGGFWDECCSGFNTDYNLWHNCIDQQEITEEEYNVLSKYVDCSIFTDEELAKVQKEMEESE